MPDPILPSTFLEPTNENDIGSYFPYLFQKRYTNILFDRHYQLFQIIRCFPNDHKITKLKPVDSGLKSTSFFNEGK